MPGDMDRIELLEAIQSLEFTIVELNLYLNTHPTDHEALIKFNKAMTEVKDLKEIYDRHYGMLTSQNSHSSYSWEWLKEPWPWQYEANYSLIGREN